MRTYTCVCAHTIYLGSRQEKKKRRLETLGRGLLDTGNVGSRHGVPCVHVLLHALLGALTLSSTDARAGGGDALFVAVLGDFLIG